MPGFTILARVRPGTMARPGFPDIPAVIVVKISTMTARQSRPVMTIGMVTKIEMPVITASVIGMATVAVVIGV